MWSSSYPHSSVTSRNLSHMSTGSNLLMLGTCSWVCINYYGLPDSDIQMLPSSVSIRSFKLATYYQSLDQEMFPAIYSMVMYLIMHWSSFSTDTLISMYSRSFLLMTRTLTWMKKWMLFGILKYHSKRLASKGNLRWTWGSVEVYILALRCMWVQTTDMWRCTLQCCTPVVQRLQETIK